MNAIWNKKWLAWGVLLLLVLNISILATIAYQYYQQGGKSTFKPAREEGILPETMFEALSFSQLQKDSIRQAKRDFLTITRPSFQHLESGRTELVREMESSEPDTLALMQLIDSLGQVQTSIKKATIRHYLKVKGFCDPAQQQQLGRYYTRMLLREGRPGKRWMKQDEGDGPREVIEHRGRHRHRGGNDSCGPAVINEN